MTQRYDDATVQRLLHDGVQLHAPGEFGDIELQYDAQYIIYRVYAPGTDEAEQEFDEFADAWDAWLAAVGREVQP